MWFYSFKETQTDMTMADIKLLENRTQNLQKKLEAKQWNINKIKDDDKAVKFYTGLPSFAVFMWLFK